MIGVAVEGVTCDDIVNCCPALITGGVVDATWMFAFAPSRMLMARLLPL